MSILTGTNGLAASSESMDSTLVIASEGGELLMMAATMLANLQFA